MVMKKLAAMSLAGMLVVGALAAEGRQATVWSSHEVKVVVEITPNITVTGPTDFQFLGEVMAGTDGVSAMVPFRLSATTPAVMMRVCATHLYKDGNADNPRAIMLRDDDPPEVISSECRAEGSADNLLPWDPQPYSLDGKSGRASQVRVFTAGKATFSADLQVKVTWANDDPTLPRGRYTGRVKLIAEVLPP